MTDSEILAVLGRLDARKHRFAREAAEVIRELLDRLQAERQAHDATIKHADEMLSRPEN